MTKCKPTTGTIKVLEAALADPRAVELLAAAVFTSAPGDSAAAEAVIAAGGDELDAAIAYHNDAAVEGGPDWNWIDDEAATAAISTARAWFEGAIALARNDAACANGRNPLDAKVCELAQRWRREQIERSGGKGKPAGPNGHFPRYAVREFKKTGHSVTNAWVRARLQAFKRNPVLRIYWEMAQTTPYQSVEETFAHFVTAGSTSD